MQEGAHEADEEGALQPPKMCRDQSRTGLSRVVLRRREAAPHGEERERVAQRRPDCPYAQRPAQADLREESVEQEREDEAAHTGAREDDATCQTASGGEPFREEFDDGQVQETAANSDSHSLEKDQLPHLRGSSQRDYLMLRACTRTCVAKLEAKSDTKYSPRPNHIPVRKKSGYRPSRNVMKKTCEFIRSDGTT